jgi:eukaryotic-like serine/threonine-protein kinase
MDEAFRLESLRSGDLPADFGPFELVRILGHGSMGRVFEAVRDGERLALKVIRPAVGPQYETFRQVLRKEARLGRLLQHPNIVPTREFGEHNGVPWLALELIDGVDLGSVLSTWGALPPTVALRIATELAGALDHAHHLQDDGTPTPVVHRDIKPANVLLERGGTTRLLDFGIAKAAMVTGMTTANGQTRGTPRYMSPEQTRGQNLDGRSDLFGLAVLLYEMLSGRRLFEGSSLIEVMSSIVSVERTTSKPGIFAAVDAAAPGVEGILRRCLRADPTHRFARASDLVDALKPLLESADGPSTEQFVRGVLDSPDPDSSERDEWEAFDSKVALSEASIDSAEVLRSVTGEHGTIPTERTAAPTDATVEQDAPRRKSSRPPTAKTPKFDSTAISQVAHGKYADTQPSSQVLPDLRTGPKSTPGPSPFSEFRTPTPVVQSESPIWWYIAAGAGVVALAVLWFALTR